jgi:uncharacterized DUF497 family protein
VKPNIYNAVEGFVALGFVPQLNCDTFGQLRYDIVTNLGKRSKEKLTLEFEWDEKNAKENQKKHDVSFEEAKTVFNDPFSITIADSKHSIDENRFIDIGLSERLRLLIVVYTERNSKIRLISSRKATPNEEKFYAQHEQ